MKEKEKNNELFYRLYLNILVVIVHALPGSFD